LVFDAAFGSDKTGGEKNKPEDYNYPCAFVFGIEETHRHKKQAEEPSQDAAEPNGQLILFGIAFFCHHFRSFFLTGSLLPMQGSMLHYAGKLIRQRLNFGHFCYISNRAAVCLLK
jgi:hypothetical protein